MSHRALIRGRQEGKSQREMGRRGAANFKDGKGLWQAAGGPEAGLGKGTILPENLQKETALRLYDFNPMMPFPAPVIQSCEILNCAVFSTTCTVVCYSSRRKLIQGLRPRRCDQYPGNLEESPEGWSQLLLWSLCSKASRTAKTLQEEPSCPPLFTDNALGC